MPEGFQQGLSLVPPCPNRDMAFLKSTGGRANSYAMLLTVGGSLVQLMMHGQQKLSAK